jgi:methylenetetrahydrofolate reductase (NADPH)
MRYGQASRPTFTSHSDTFSSCTSAQGFANLLARIQRLAALDPLAISITWGAGGSTKDRSLDLAEFTQVEYGIDTVMHLTCTNMEQGTVEDVLRVHYQFFYLIATCLTHRV